MLKKIFICVEVISADGDGNECVIPSSEDHWVVADVDDNGYTSHVNRHNEPEEVQRVKVVGHSGNAFIVNDYDSTVDMHQWNDIVNGSVDRIVLVKRDDCTYAALGDVDWDNEVIKIIPADESA